jgi:hypothetical protein
MKTICPLSFGQWPDQFGRTNAPFFYFVFVKTTTNAPFFSLFLTFCENDNTVTDNRVPA